MKLKQIAEKLDLENLTPQIDVSNSPEITTGYVSDLLSDVLAGAPKDALLITVQVHLNVIAVAVHAGLAGVIFASGRRPDNGVIEKAVTENIPLFISRASSFQIAGRLYSIGLRGPEE